MQHLLDIDSLNPELIKKLIDKALQFKKTGIYPSFPKQSLATLFYENSTRTRVSFELAAKYMQMQVINLDLQTSSESKGERMEDTLNTLAAMGISTFVIRHKEEGIARSLAEALVQPIHIINAGDGKNAHPSQALLDLMTIGERKADLASLKIAILGDIRHSRVANSFQQIAAMMGLRKISFIAPKLWQPMQPVHGLLTESLEEGLQDADVVICLRVQRERILGTEQLDLENYRKHFSLNQQSIQYAKSDALILHPGPINRGLEIESVLADGSQSCILQQVQNGVFMRMAILEAVRV